MEKFLIQLCLNLNDNLSVNEQEKDLSTNGLIIINSFIVDEAWKENVISNNIPIIVEWLINEWNSLIKETKWSTKFSKKDFVIMTIPVTCLNFSFLK